ncbi:MAG: type II toxin-antitoxin system HicB family antitoxin [Abitibacteriaceae bacterium]|nr:type II toxin-antitoxin system HicB family antitoxin [Abditibacteriaceae bacterium]
MVILHAEEDGGYSVSCPALPGCHSQGDTFEEALENINEAAELYLEVVAEQASQSPKPRKIRTHATTAA